MQLTTSEIGQQLEAVRNTVPLVHCMTNSVVTQFTANVLLALSSAPAMVDVPEEAGAFTRMASALLVNLGTPGSEQRDAMRQAVPVAAETRTPWVLDPVAVGALPLRTQLAADLIAYEPTAIRGNPSEILALAGIGTGGRGVEAVDGPEAALDAARTLASRYHSVVAVSGATDVITDGITELRLSYGHEWLTTITGGGCALGAVTAAFLAANPDNPLHAVASATATFTIAAEQAAAVSSGPGSFAVALIDTLYELDKSAIDTQANTG